MSLNLDRFKELNLEGKTFKNVISKDDFIWGKTLNLEQNGSYIFSTKLK